MAESQFESKFKPLLAIWQSLSNAVPGSRRQLKVLAAKLMAKLMGPRSFTA